MKEKILALLTARFAGVRKDGLAQLAGAISLQADDEAAATALVEKLTPEKVNSFVKDWRSEVDKEVSDSNKTYETNLRKKYEMVEKKDQDPGKQTDQKSTDPNDIAAIIANAIKAAVEPLQKEISSFKGQKITETRLQQMESKLVNVPDAFKSQKLKDFKRMNFENEETFAEYLGEVETDIMALNQELADKGLSGQTKPIMGAKNKDGVSSAVNSYIESKTKPESSLGGKEV